MLRTILALIPPLFGVIFMYIIDSKERERKSVLIRLFFWGVLISIPIVIIELILDKIVLWPFAEDGIVHAFLNAFAIAALVEETFKWLVMRFRVRNMRDYNCKFDGLVFVTCVTLGFAAFENILYVIAGGISTAFIRSITAIPGHFCFSIFIGFFMSKSKEAKRLGRKGLSVIFSILSLIVPIILHGIYDFCLMSQNAFLIILWIPFMVVMFIAVFIIIIWCAVKDDYFTGYTDVWTCPLCKKKMSTKYCKTCRTNRHVWICGECNAVNENNFCWKCGAAHVTDPAVAPVVEPVAEQVVEYATEPVVAYATESVVAYATESAGYASEQVVEPVEGE